ncbi:hypothetical protein SAMN05444149_108100 [Pseudosulfitobacter pseudonitzschiae]|uniref:Uncharacterized protein n=1 Tax=Pseudosulfitobacter pseudonitzschiae TaxID=1402135 RepID=A0A073IUH2_9RHOB|nr:hypothetical protein [Pseudosulfitobacter pseudonitzschiae]KEJ93983.1 hypothetical protein SUH3_11980 [Pseudosulfitobacter pseudonitzschiae]SHG01658.1 hypothetical protein SAMN05444149_108100 [Pseudosulfitobacter pseudonitzschiae]
MQGPFRGVAGSLARAFGGTVTLHYGTPQARDVSAVFRRVPRRVDGLNGAEIETLVPVLRASRPELADLAEGDLVDPKDGRIYRFLFLEESPSPASDALVTAQLEDVQ